MNIALFEPDIPQNTGSLIRLSACLGIGLHIIEPCGFLLNDKQLKRVAMDYNEQTTIHRHRSWETFTSSLPQNSRIILLTTKAKTVYTEFTFTKNDILLLGRESSGVPNKVIDASQAQIKIPMYKNARSLNVALAAAMILGESLRQTGFNHD